MTRSIKFPLVLAAMSLAGCNVYDPSLIKNGDGGTVTQCTPGSIGCIPPRPAASTSDPADSIDLTYALRDIRLDQTDSQAASTAQPWQSIGFDLDGINTDAPGAPTSCKVPVGADGGISDLYPVDGKNGIDNQFGAQLSSALLPLVDPYLAQDLCCMQSRGRGTVLLRIRNWNGQPNDASVTISLTTAVDGTSADGQTVHFDGTTENGYVNNGDGLAAPLPSWQPNTDTWLTSASDVSTSDINKPRHVDVTGYVVGSYLVMRLDVTAPIKLYLGSLHGISIGLRGGTLMAKISPSQNLLTEGWMGGRMGSTELTDATFRLRASELYSTYAMNLFNGTSGGSMTDNGPNCTNAAASVTPIITAVGDVLADGSNNPSIDCDALSAGVFFHGVRAKDASAVAPIGLAIPMPDCPGQTMSFGTKTPDEAVCPFNNAAMPSVCSLPLWNGNL